VDYLPEMREKGSGDVLTLTEKRTHLKDCETLPATPLPHQSAASIGGMLLRNAVRVATAGLGASGKNAPRPVLPLRLV
jgi:hypothetical protein